MVVNMDKQRLMFCCSSLFLSFKCKARGREEHPTWQGLIGKTNDNQTMTFLVMAMFNKDEILLGSINC
jgi:hypothetical protein